MKKSSPVIALLVIACLAVGALGHSHSHSHGHSHDHEEPKPSFKYSREANVQQQPAAAKPAAGTGCPFHSAAGAATQAKDASSVWLQAMGSTLLISIAPYVILFFIPLDNSPKYQPWLKVLLSFASGGLLGDAFLHLIPHAMSAQESEDGGHAHSHSHGGGHSDEPHVHDLSVGLWVIGGFLVFFMVEKFVRIVNGHGHGHSHQHTHDKQDKSSESTHKSDKLSDSETKKKAKQSDNETDSDTEIESDNETERQSTKELVTEPVQEIKVAGYLNLAADFTHNLTDGLAIGASYLAGQSIGIVTTVTILLHEVPHEIGDFAILIQSGCSRAKAMRLQLVTALGALTGTAISLFATGLGESASAWILPFTAGGFIYIAAVSVIPELLENSTVWQTFKEVLAFIVGILMMVLISWFE